MKITNQIRKLSSDERFACLNYVYLDMKLFENKSEFKNFLKKLIRISLKNDNYNHQNNMVARCIYCLAVVSQYPMIPKLRYRS